MKTYIAQFTAGASLLLSACTSAPEVRPNVGDGQITPREISPGESFEVSFTLFVNDPTVVERIYLRGLPQNTVAAGTRTELAPPTKQSSDYRARFEVKAPAMDGQHNLELVIVTSGKTYVAPFGALAIRDTPSRILHSQFLPGSHAAADCQTGTRLLTFEYAVADENGAADFVGPTLLPVDQGSDAFVFFPRWEPIYWLGGKPGIALNQPTDSARTEELVTSKIRINCRMPQASLYQYDVKGQSISRLTGRSTDAEAIRVRYFVK